LKIELPRLYVDGFPKSGLHLAELMVASLYHPNPRKVWFGTNAWTTEKNNMDKLAALATIDKGHYMKGHSGYDAEFDRMLTGLQIGMVFIYRDLRDVVVSQAYHILSSDEHLKHPARELYPNNLQGVMKCVIEGIGDFDGIFPRWMSYEKWLHKSWVYPVKYDELLKRPHKVAKGFIEYVISLELYHTNQEQAHIDKEHFHDTVEHIVKNTRNKGTVTFRKGKAHQWRYEFTPELVELFKEHDTDNMLVRLGFEKNRNWN